MIEIGELIKFSFTQKIIKYDTKLIAMPPERRDVNYYWKKPKIKSFHYIIEFDDEVILSRIVFSKPNDVKFYYYISLEENGDHIVMEKETYCKNGALKMMDFHFFPCKYVHFITLNDMPFPKKEQVKCYGFYKNNFKEKYGENMLQMIFNKTSKILYNKNKNINKK